MSSNESFRLYLQKELLQRCKRNPRYSLRSYAKALKINHATLSGILKGTRPLSAKTIKNLGLALGLGPVELDSFLASSGSDASASHQEFRQLGLDVFVAVSDWYHDAILELTRVQGFRGDSRWIAARLGITPSEVAIAVERLVRLELLEIQEDGAWRDKSADNTTIVGNDFTAVAFRKLQRQLLELSIEKLEAVPKPLREHSSMTMAIDLRDLPLAKEMIKKFRRELCGFLQRPGSCPDHVYQFTAGLFPLTQVQNQEEEEDESV